MKKQLLALALLSLGSSVVAADASDYQASLSDRHKEITVFFDGLARALYGDFANKETSHLRPHADIKTEVGVRLRKEESDSDINSGRQPYLRINLINPEYKNTTSTFECEELPSFWKRRKIELLATLIRKTLSISDGNAPRYTVENLRDAFLSLPADRLENFSLVAIKPHLEAQIIRK